MRVQPGYHFIAECLLLRFLCVFDTTNADQRIYYFRSKPVIHSQSQALSEPKRSNLPVDAALFVAIASLALLPALGEGQMLVGIAGAALILLVPTSTTAAGMRAATAVGILCLYAGFAKAWFVWPLYLLVPCGAAFLFGRTGDKKRHITLVRLGRLGRSEFAAILMIALVSAAALVAWIGVLHPDLSRFVALLPDWPTILLLLLGIGFSIVNAVLEELLWRGFLQSWLLSVVNPAVAIAVQAVSFGAFHFTGFPGGLAGISLATVYGLMLGALAFRCKGLLAPCIAHVAADAIIFAITLERSWR
jgi:membrane protease YdiL (CAAX protease family)